VQFDADRDTGNTTEGVAMTITPTRLPGPAAALARTAARFADALNRTATGPSVVIALSACAAGMMTTLGTAVAFA
jgi:hypothetical protein